MKQRPEIRSGYTVRVFERIQEGSKERVQVFEGLVISVHKGATPTDSTFMVRRIASGVGVEKVFLLHSPNIEKIEVKKVAKVRRSKLFFLRGRSGKSARLSERFTTADEFAIAAAVEEEKEEVKEEAPEPSADSAGSGQAKEEEVKEKKEEVKEEEPKEEATKSSVDYADSGQAKSEEKKEA